MWDGKYSVRENGGAVPAPGLGEDRRSGQVAWRGMRGGVAWTAPTVGKRRNGRQEVLVGNATITHARHVEATIVSCGTDLWSVGGTVCHLHHASETIETSACYGVLCYSNRSILVREGALQRGAASVFAPRVTAFTASGGAVISGNDVFVANASCVTGVFSGLAACVKDRPNWQTTAVASENSVIYILDSITGDVLAFPHYELPTMALRTFLAATKGPVARATARAASVAPLRNRKGGILGATVATQRLAIGGATGLAVQNNQITRTFKSTIVVSVAPAATASGVYGEYVPEELCAEVQHERCPWYQYSRNGVCTLRNQPNCPRIAIFGDKDTTCLPEPAAHDYGHHRCVSSLSCTSGWARTHLGELTTRCCSPMPCDGVYNYHTEVCHPNARKRRQVSQEPECPPTQLPTSSPNTAPTPPNACGVGEYGMACSPCSACRAGQRLITPCGAANTLCGDCPRGTYMDLHAHTLRLCKPGNGCAGATTTHDGDCTTIPMSKARWGLLALPLYGCAVHAAIAYRKARQA